ncbi:MAG: MogA/MoaB family molybdenum cofactor biosynthesis protein [Candidatus Njordarchaeales archaeon]
MKKHLHEVEKFPEIVKFAIITVSTSRAKAKARGLDIEDTSGDIAEELIKERGFKVVYRDLIPDGIKPVRESLDKALRAGAEIIIFIGGTGITKDDVTIEAIEPLLEKKLDGFGDLFRFLSYQEVGSIAMLSRAMAGVYKNTMIFCLPGSTSAVKLGLTKLILQEARHIVYLLKRKGDANSYS